MLIIGLTGGICSGKSTVSAIFEKLGVPVIDADLIARELVMPGLPAHARIISVFGRGIIARDGSLDRDRMRRIVFADPEKRKTLENILHPLIRKEMQQRAAKLDTPYCIFSIPLLIESRQQTLVNRILVVDVPESLQYTRLKQRDRMTDKEVRAILSAQADRKQRLEFADDIIINDRDFTSLGKQVEALHQQYLVMAGEIA